MEGVFKMKWPKWDGVREVSKEEKYAKAKDLLISGIPYDSMRNWTNRQILDAWEELE